jgi:hypothetical protein
MALAHVPVLALLDQPMPGGTPQSPPTDDDVLSQQRQDDALSRLQRARRGDRGQDQGGGTGVLGERDDQPGLQPSVVPKLSR